MAYGKKPMAEMEQGDMAEGGEGGDVQSAVAEVMDKMGALAEIVGSMPDATPEMAKRLQSLMSEFGSIMAELSGEGMPEQQPKPGASPIRSAQGRPVGPAGV